MDALRVEARVEHLSRLTGFVESRARESGAPEALVLKVTLVLEEAVVNVCDHAYSGPGGEVEAAVGRVDSPSGKPMLQLVIRDWGPPFDPLSQDPPDITAGLEDRPVGGLGIHFMTTMTDERSYARKEEMNELRFWFCLDADDATESGPE